MGPETIARKSQIQASAVAAFIKETFAEGTRRTRDLPVYRHCANCADDVHLLSRRRSVVVGQGFLERPLHDQSRETDHDNAPYPSRFLTAYSSLVPPVLSSESV